MSASPLTESVCRRCGEELGPRARFCPNCGTPAGELPPLETVPGPVVRDSVERRRLGVPARFVLLCLGFAGLGAAIGLFATGHWASGVVAVLVAVVLFAALSEATRRSSDAPAGSVRLAADGREHATTAVEVWRTRLDTNVARWRARTRLSTIERERKPALQSLGDAVWRGDFAAEDEARQRLSELDAERRRTEDELDERLAGAEERIRRARLPVQKTQMVTPNEPSAPYPPPDEGNPPEPAQVPEPYPPPDEGTPPTPAPDPGRADD